MSDIKFDDARGLNRSVTAKKQGGLEKMLIDKGIAKDKKQAETILIGIAIVAFVLTGIVLLTQGNGSTSSSSETNQYTEEFIPAE